MTTIREKMGHLVCQPLAVGSSPKSVSTTSPANPITDAVQIAVTEQPTMSKRAESEPVTSRSFELRFCGILILLILAIVVLVTLVVIQLLDRWQFLIMTTDGP